ncbi:MAG: transposase, partial [Acidobacteriota bacterium]
TEPACCDAFLEELRSVNQKWLSKLITYVLMPDHFHLISNPRDGRIKEFVGSLKSLSAKSIVRVCKQFRFHASSDGHQKWSYESVSGYSLVSIESQFVFESLLGLLPRSVHHSFSVFQIFICLSPVNRDCVRYGCQEG